MLAELPSMHPASASLCYEIPPVSGDFRRYVTNALNIQIPMLLRERELTGKMLAHDITIKQSHRTTAIFEQLDHQSVGNCRFSGARKPGKKTA